MSDTEEKQQDSTQNQEPVESETDKLKKEKDEYLDGWKRAKADLINYKKDEAKRFEVVLKFANEQMIMDLILVLDSFDLALQSLEKEAKIEKGVYMIRTQLEDLMKKYGLEKVEVKIGEQFDPATQEAVLVVESEKPSGSVIDEIEKGYSLGGKLIRPARVKVSK